VSAENVKIVESMYAAFAKGDIPTVLAALDPQVEWWEAENFIYADGNPYVGPEAVLQGVFMPIVSDWDGFAVTPKEVLDAGDTAIGQGPLQRYAQTNRQAGARAVRALLHVSRWKDCKVSAIHRHRTVPTSGIDSGLSRPQSCAAAASIRADSLRSDR